MIEVSGRGFGGKLFTKRFPPILTFFECALVLVDCKLAVRRSEGDHRGLRAVEGAAGALRDEIASRDKSTDNDVILIR